MAMLASIRTQDASLTFRACFLLRTISFPGLAAMAGDFITYRLWFEAKMATMLIARFVMWCGPDSNHFYHHQRRLHFSAVRQGWVWSCLGRGWGG